MAVEAHSLVGDFAGTDELLAMGQAGRLDGFGPIFVTRSGRIGPLVELAGGRFSEFSMKGAHERRR
jgi:hypothetical protein